MIGRTNTGGGTSLNFKVVGNPQPTNPKENMFWLDTDQKITEWSFAVENPYIHTTEDLYTDVGAKSGYYLNSSGEEVASTSYTNFKEVSGNIMLPAGAISVTVVSGSTATTSVAHGFYDADGKLISTVMRETGTADYDVPTGAASIRISVRNDDPGSLFATYMASKAGTWRISSTAGEIVGTAGGITFTKKNSGKAIFAFMRNQNYTIPLLISDNEDAAVLIGDNGYEHGAFAFTYKGKIYYNTYPGLGIDLWDTASPKMKWTIDPVAVKEYLVEIFEGNKPNSVPEGALWITTGTSSNVEFNALKKNSILIYPLSAKQYISGVFVDVPAKVYRDGEWKQMIPDLVLYDRGNEYATITKSGTGTVTKYSDYIQIKTSDDATSTTDANISGVYDLTNYKTLVVEYKNITQTTNFQVQVMDKNDTSIIVLRLAMSGAISSEIKTATADVSSLNAEYKLRIRNYSTNAVRTGNVYSLKLLAT